MKRILVLSTGGTIGSDNSDTGLTPKLTFGEIISKLPKMSLDIELFGVQVMNIDSGNMNPTHWQKVVTQIEKDYADYDGFVVTHGTDTLSFTAAALSYLIQNPKKPIVLTGSQIPIGFEGTDAIKNLTRSIILANGDVGGVFIVFNDKAILGTGARKIKSKSDDAFVTLNTPYVATFEGDSIKWNTKVVNKLQQNRELIAFYKNINPKVALLKLAPGLRPDVVLYLAEHYDAIVIEAYGIGSVPFDEGNNFLDALKLATQKNCVVLIVSQALNQGTFMQKYEISRKALFVENVIEGGLLSTECAITKLMWALGITSDRNEVKRLINKPVALDKIKVEEN